MKKLVALALCVTMAFSLSACGSSSASNNAASTAGSEAGETASAAADSEAASDMRVAMITDYGDITDQSFNQTTYEECKAWTEANGVDFTYYKPEGDSTADREAMIDKAYADGYNVFVLPGYAFAEAITNSADNYPDAKYVALDVSQADLDSASGEEGYMRDNVYCAVYQEELSGYMAGVAAVKMGYKKVGFLGGMAVPAVMRFGYGFVQGVDAAAAELGLSDVEVNYAYGNQFSGDADITAAMDTWYQGGTEVVFACGGGIWSSAAEAAAKVDGKVIGVDVDQKATIDDKYGEGITVTSAMKGLKETVDTLLDAIKAGEWDQYKGQIQNLGLVSGDDVEANYVQLPLESTAWNDTFTVDDYKELVKNMFDGTIKVSNDVSAEEPTATTAKVNFQGNIK